MNILKSSRCSGLLSLPSPEVSLFSQPIPPPRW